MSRTASTQSIGRQVGNPVAAPTGLRYVVGMMAALFCFTAVQQGVAAPTLQNEEQATSGQVDAKVTVAAFAIEVAPGTGGVHQRTVTPDGIAVITFANGAEIRFAPEGSAEASAASCGKENFCVWSAKNYKGDKVTWTQLGGPVCWSLSKGYFPVKSLIAGSSRGGVTMWTKRKCKGKASPTYVPGAKVRDTGYKGGFHLRSIR